MEVLTTYVRTHAPHEPDATEPLQPPEPEIQAILTVIARRSIHHKDVEVESGRIDLSFTNLTLADLQGADLSGANLFGAVFRAANISGANLEGAAFSTEELDKAIGDDMTRLPYGVKPPAHWWGVKTDEQAKED
jgi:hypothetical protein